MGAPKLHDQDHSALRAAFARAVTALRELADELDASGLRPMGTTMLHEAQEILSMKVAALQRLQTSNDNQGQT